MMAHLAAQNWAIGRDDVAFESHSTSQSLEMSFSIIALSQKANTDLHGLRLVPSLILRVHCDEAKNEQVEWSRHNGQAKQDEDECKHDILWFFTESIVFLECYLKMHALNSRFLLRLLVTTIVFSRLAELFKRDGYLSSRTLGRVK